MKRTPVFLRSAAPALDLITVTRSGYRCCQNRAIPRCHSVQFSSVQLLSRVRLFVTPWTAACQPSLSIANSRSLLKLMSVELVMPSNHLILCHPLLLLPSIFPSIRIFSNGSVLCIRRLILDKYLLEALVFQNEDCML